MSLFEAVVNDDFGEVFDIIIINQEELSTDEVIESIMYILNDGNPDLLNILITGITYSAVISILYILLQNEDVEHIQTLFDSSKIMDLILFNRDLEDLLDLGLNPNITGLYDDDRKRTISYGFLNYIIKSIQEFSFDIPIALEYFRLLLRLGANPDNKAEFGWTPLHISDLEFSKLLLQYNANPNIRDNDDNTPLYMAFFKNNIDKMELLLQYGADPYIQNDRGRNIFNFPIDVHNNDPFFGRPGRRIEESTIQFVKDYVNLKKARQNLALMSHLNTRLGIDSPLNYLDESDIIKEITSKPRRYDPSVNIRMMDERRRDRDKLTKSLQRLASMRSMHSREGPISTVRYDPSIMEGISRHLSRIRPVPSLQERLMLEDKDRKGGSKRSSRSSSRKNKYYTRRRSFF